MNKELYYNACNIEWVHLKKRFLGGWKVKFETVNNFNIISINFKKYEDALELYQSFIH